MGKKLNTALIIGALALGGFALYKALGKTAVTDILGGGGGELVGPGGSEQGGGAISGSGSETGPIVGGGGGSEGGGGPAVTPQQAYLTGNIMQILQGMIVKTSPLDPDYAGNYPALDVNEQGLFVNRETGEVYPIDPETGRQVRWLEGGERGAFIATPEGMPYGTQTYIPIPEGGLKRTIPAEESGEGREIEVTSYKIGTEEGAYYGSRANVLIETSPGRVRGGLAGVNPSTGQGWVWSGWM